MVTRNIIRSIIFITVGLILIYFPKQVATFQSKVLDKLKVNYKDPTKTNRTFAIILIIIAIILIIIENS
tara:strand:- start:2949 stop:3155 length:207 start_codon:yes stop_codon:yes gene_type:complete